MYDREEVASHEAPKNGEKRKKGFRDYSVVHELGHELGIFGVPFEHRRMVLLRESVMHWRNDPKEKER